ncbi:hypothetical protein [Chitinophaga sp. S165]|uniref:hypothetical protein n=1 Tax=Chitinophaga sp. S165 TaxID=2135462 RepID=UPI000D70E142|nr:hypothetical protein [Chitinophaga sp. S165]PWV51572.1 hypothetical protein C7475_103181 [Chitinophaga sp. S165]
MKKVFFSVAALAALCFVACSKDEDKDPTPQVDAPKDSIVVYRDVVFSMDAGDTIGRAFSTQYGKMYTDSKIPTDSNAKYIDLVGGSVELGTIFFASPDSLRELEGITITGATKTIIQHNVTDTTIMSPFKFDTLAHASTLNGITVKGDADFDGFEYPSVLFFQNARGKKGVILYKGMARDLTTFTVDIKVQY